MSGDDGEDLRWENIERVKGGKGPGYFYCGDMMTEARALWCSRCGKRRDVVSMEILTPCSKCGNTEYRYLLPNPEDLPVELKTIPSIVMLLISANRTGLVAVKFGDTGDGDAATPKDDAILEEIAALGAKYIFSLGGQDPEWLEYVKQYDPASGSSDIVSRTVEILDKLHNIGKIGVVNLFQVEKDFHYFDWLDFPDYEGDYYNADPNGFDGILKHPGNPSLASPCSLSDYVSNVVTKCQPYTDYFQVGYEIDRTKYFINPPLDTTVLDPSSENYNPDCPYLKAIGNFTDLLVRTWVLIKVIGINGNTYPNIKIMFPALTGDRNMREVEGTDEWVLESVDEMRSVIFFKAVMDRIENKKEEVLTDYGLDPESYRNAPVFDILPIHWHNSTYVEGESSANPLPWSMFIEFYERVKEILGEHEGYEDIPIWFTETGLGSEREWDWNDKHMLNPMGSPEGQARDVWRRFAVGFGCGAEKAGWFNFIPIPGSKQQTYGLLSATEDANEYESLAEFRKLSWWAFYRLSTTLGRYPYSFIFEQGEDGGIFGVYFYRIDIKKLGSNLRLTRETLKVLWVDPRNYYTWEGYIDESSIPSLRYTVYLPVSGEIIYPVPYDIISNIPLYKDSLSLAAGEHRIELTPEPIIVRYEYQSDIPIVPKDIPTFQDDTTIFKPLDMKVPEEPQVTSARYIDDYYKSVKAGIYEGMKELQKIKKIIREPTFPESTVPRGRVIDEVINSIIENILVSEAEKSGINIEIRRI